MKGKRYIRKEVRFHRKNTSKLIINGWYPEGIQKDIRLRALLNGMEAACEAEWKKEPGEEAESLIVTVSCRRDITAEDTITVEEAYEEGFKEIARITGKDIRNMQRDIQYYIDEAKLNCGELTVQGWECSNLPAVIKIYDDSQREIPSSIERFYRADIGSIYSELSENNQCGFYIKAMNVRSDVLTFAVEGLYAKRQETLSFTKKNKQTRHRGLRLLVSQGLQYCRCYGLKKTAKRTLEVFMQRENYDRWLTAHMPNEEELKRQREEEFEVKPLFSIIVPLYKTPEKFLREMIESVRSQTYPVWELCLADGSGINSPIKSILEEYRKKDGRIRYKILKENEGISGNTNAALAMADGDFIVLVDHDDTIPQNALYECVRAVNQDKTIDVIYTDEDKIDMKGKKHSGPHFKPEFNPDLLCSLNYITHLFVVKKEIVDRIGNFQKKYDGAQDLDFILRCTEQAVRIHHIPKILYHWRIHMKSVAGDPESKMYAYEAGRKAIEAHYERVGLKAEVTMGANYGIYNTHYQWDETPLVSILIPNKDHIKDLELCIDSLKKSTYQNYEIIVIENNSTNPKTFLYYETLQKENDKVRVVTWEHEFNYAKINNFGAKHAEGEYLFLLNNDTEMINASAIQEMLGYAMREDVGIVGAKLYFDDDTIQHAGVVIGIGGSAAHLYSGVSKHQFAYFCRENCAQDYSAVTAACMMTRRSVFEEVGGMTEQFVVAFNDVDYCLKVRETNKLVVYNPNAEFYHFESKSRGYEDTPEKKQRFERERDLLISRWKKYYEEGDPYYSPNLTDENVDCSLNMKMLEGKK